MSMKTPTSGECALTLNAAKATIKATAFAEELHGRTHGRKAAVDLHECHGAPALLEAAFVRTYRTDPHMLVIRLGDDWYAVGNVPLGAVEAAGLPIVETGRDPQHIEAEERRAAERRAQIEQEEAAKESRRRFWQKRREESAKAHRAALDARQ